MPCNVVDGVLTIGAGESCEIDANHPAVIQRLVMGDNSILRVRGTEAWDVDIEEAVFGDNCLWDLRGADGADAPQDRPRTRGQSKHCKDGNEGREGREGGRASDGVDLDLTIGLESLGGWTIDASGGRGGDGGPGGKGGKGGAGKFGCAYSGDGGRGGRGGHGGRGGDTGQVRVRYYWHRGQASALAASVDGDVIPDLTDVGLVFVSEPGDGGKPGAPGSPGGRGEQNSARNRGSKGKKGRAGAWGRTGEDIPEVVELIIRGDDD